MVQVECCDLCYEDGEIKEATARYTPDQINFYAICEECKNKIEKMQEKNEINVFILPL